MDQEYVKVCVNLRRIDLEHLEQIIKWNDGQRRGDRSATIRMAVTEKYNRMKKLYEMKQLEAVNESPSLPHNT